MSFFFFLGGGGGESMEHDSYSPASQHGIMLLFRVPDLVRTLLFRYLDGPSACALLQTCRRFHYFLKDDIAGLVRVRFAPRDDLFFALRVLRKAHVCVSCSGINACKPNCLPLLRSGECRGRRVVKDACCYRCQKRVRTRDAMPWVVHLYPAVSCVTCKKQLDLRTESAERRETSGCMLCGVVCRVCNGSYVVCGIDGCREEVKAHLVRRHREQEHRSWYHSVLETCAAVADAARSGARALGIGDDSVTPETFSIALDAPVHHPRGCWCDAYRDRLPRIGPTRKKR
jgi:hypothetical protein